MNIHVGHEQMPEIYFKVNNKTSKWETFFVLCLVEKLAGERDLFEELDDGWMLVLAGLLCHVPVGVCSTCMLQQLVCRHGGFATQRAHKLSWRFRSPLWQRCRNEGLRARYQCIARFCHRRLELKWEFVRFLKNLIFISFWKTKKCFIKKDTQGIRRQKSINLFHIETVDTFY